MGEAFVGASAAIAARAPGDRGGSAGATLEAQSWQRAEAGLRGGQTALLDARTNAVVDRLLTQHSEGRELTRYAEALIERGDSGTIGRHLTRLQRGDALDETVESRFGYNTPTGSSPEQVDNASRLGYAVGAVSTAFDNRATSLRADVQELAGVLRYVVPEYAADAAQEGFNNLMIDGKVATIEEARQLLVDEAVPTDDNRDKYGHAVQRAYDSARTTVSQFSSE